jgi:hypothetical protein
MPLLASLPLPFLAQIASEEAAAVVFGAGLGVLLLIGFIGLLSLAGLVFWIWMLVDCAQHLEEEPGGNRRVVWILVLVFPNWLGALVYFFVERQPRVAARRARGFTSPPFRPGEARRMPRS